MANSKDVYVRTELIRLVRVYITIIEEGIMDSRRRRGGTQEELEGGVVEMR